jgi:hypothetical protein
MHEETKWQSNSKQMVRGEKHKETDMNLFWSKNTSVEALRYTIHDAQNKIFKT